MKNILILFLNFTILLACTNNDPESGSFTSLDEKSSIVKSHLEAYMNNDSGVAEKLFEEDLKIYDQFSNNQENGQTLENPGGRNGLIEADKFTHLLFNNIKVTTDNVKTFVLSDGRTYTSFWSMWSGVGNFTGKSTTIPFHCVSQWENGKVSKVWRYMDPTALNQEIDAFEGENNTSNKVIGAAELVVNKGFSKSDVEEFLVRFTKFVRDTEPGLYDFNYFISPNGKRVNLIEKYKTSDDFIFHLNNFEQSDFSKEFMKLFTLEKVMVLGNSSEALVEKAKGYGAEFRSKIGGWIN